MKKTVTIILSILLLLLTFVSCDTEDDQGALASLDYDSSKVQENMEKLINEKGLYIELSVSGRDENGETEQEVIAYGETATAFYYKSDGRESIIDFSNDAYAVSYERDENEKWEKDTIVYADIGMTKETFQQTYSTYTSILFSYFSSYSVYSGFDMKKSSDTVAGRACDKFTYEATALGAGVTYTFSIDKETGMCLKWEATAAALGEGMATADFTCTEFKTEYTIEIPADENVLPEST